MLDFLREFQGILGAILGAVSTLITTNILRRFGKINLYIIKKEIELFKKSQSDYGLTIEEVASDYNEADSLKYSFELVFYNSSDIYKSFFDINLKFIGDNKRVFFHKPYDQAKSYFTSQRWVHEEIDTIELEPKKLKVVKLNGWLDKEELIKSTNMTNIIKIYLVAKNSKNKKFRKKIFG